jgi:hypothetical protein
MTLTIIGALTGGLMTRPTQQQLEAARAGAPMTIVGAHTIGAPDGGPGIPVTAWSSRHGDVRVPHFVGLHALQALAFVAIALRLWRRPDDVRVKVVLAASASYAALFALLLFQALQGRSITSTDPVTLTAFSAWAALTALSIGWIGFGSLAAVRRDALHGMTI